MQRSRKWLMALLASGLFLGGLFILLGREELALHIFAITLLGLGNGFMFAMPFALLARQRQSGEHEHFNICASGRLHTAAIGPAALGYLYDLTQVDGTDHLYDVGSLAYLVFGKSRRSR